MPKSKIRKKRVSESEESRRGRQYDRAMRELQRDNAGKDKEAADA